MAQKKQVIGKDGRLKTLIKAERSREDRIEQHMHGRSDHVRMENDGVKYGIYAFMSTIVIGFILLFLWLALT